MAKKPPKPDEEAPARKPFLERLVLKNVLSFKELDFEFRNLNILIGPNASGKSNLIDAIRLLRGCTTEPGRIFAKGGGYGEWVYKGAKPPAPLAVEAHLNAPGAENAIHSFSLRQAGMSYEFEREELSVAAGPSRGLLRIEKGLLTRWDEYPSNQTEEPYLQGNRSLLEFGVFPQRHARAVSQAYKSIQVYMDWSFGRANQARGPAPADDPGDVLYGNARNLAMVLNWMKQSDAFRAAVEEAKELYPGFNGLDFVTIGGTLNMYVEEDIGRISSWRLSDGTLRYLALLAILLQPDPPPLVCIEEPELGLHPDMMPRLAKLLQEASERMQLIVTTHSEHLIDALSDDVESVVVCERGEGGTSLRRLDQKELGVWLEKYTLGTLWSRGDIGGNRW